jgi:polyisoprenoid-binding protein YceI
MKRFNLFIAFAAFAFASCTSTDSKTEAVNTESTTEEVATASSALIPDGNYIVTNIATVVTWVAKKAVGDGHTGIIPVSNGKFKVKNGQISDGSIIFDMTGFTVTDLEGESKANFDEHLKSVDFLETEKFPTAVLTLKNTIEDGGDLHVNASLSMHGVSQPYNIPIVIKPFKKDGQDMFSVYGEIFIDRTKHKIVYGSGSFFDNLGDKAINDDILIKFELTAL